MWNTCALLELNKQQFCVMGDRHSFLTQPRVLETIQNAPGPALDGHPSLKAVYLGLTLCEVQGNACPTLGLRVYLYLSLPVF